MAMLSRQLRRNQQRFDVAAHVQSRAAPVNEHGEIVNGLDQPLLAVWAEIKALGSRGEGVTEIAAGNEISINRYRVTINFDEQVYAALRTSRSVFIFDGFTCEISNIVIQPSFSRARYITFRAWHGHQDFSKIPA